MPQINKEKIKNIRFFECNRKFISSTSLKSGSCALNSSECTLSSIGWVYGSDTIVIFPNDTGLVSFHLQLALNSSYKSITDY